MKISRLGKAATFVAGSAIAALALTGCSATTDTGATGDGAGTDGIDVYVVGGMPSDPFWSVVKSGAEAAGAAVEAAGGSVTWLGPQNYDNLGPDAGKLVDDAIAAGAEAIVIADWVPDAENPAIQRAVAAGIPVIHYNAGGLEQADATGALT